MGPKCKQTNKQKNKAPWGVEGEDNPIRGLKDPLISLDPVLLPGLREEEELMSSLEG